MGVTLLDSSAVIAFLDRSEKHHPAARKRVGELAREDFLVVSAVSYAEILTGARRGHHEESLVLGFFRSLVSIVAPVTVEIADRAATLRATTGLRLPDALILATAELHPAGLVLGCERSWAKLPGYRVPYERLTY